jgi:two-component system chemotaxis response regulator CheB
MNRKTRVLIVDDSVVIRRLLSDVVTADPQMEVAGYAANGQIAIAMLDQVSPDIVTLDVEMPVMDGIETLKAIRARRQKLPVIMFSTLTERGAEATIDCLAAGASDYVAKPANVGSFSVSKERICEVLLPKIRALCGGLQQAPQALPKRILPALSQRNAAPDRIDVVVIGCSTGGPNALAELLPALPADFPVPILIVQHMPPAFTRFLAQRLNASSKLQVKEAEAGAIVEPGTAWIAPGDHHMVAVRVGTTVRLATNQDSPENSCRPSVDVLFRSVAKAYNRSTVLAIVLTGMGQDGLRGCEQLADTNAHIVVQDEQTSVVWGMPGFVAKAGLADAVLPLSQLAPYMVRRVAPSGLKGMAVATYLTMRSS